MYILFRPLKGCEFPQLANKIEVYGIIVTGHDASTWYNEYICFVCCCNNMRSAHEIETLADF